MVLASYPSALLTSLSRIRPTFPSHELLQEAVPGARVREHLDHVVEMVIGDSHILCVAGDIDHLEKQKIPPHTHIHTSLAPSSHSKPGTRHYSKC